MIRVINYVRFVYTVHGANVFVLALGHPWMCHIEEYGVSRRIEPGAKVQKKRCVERQLKSY